MSNNIPASIGMPIEEIDTPCLLLELDAFERNVARMANFIKENGVRHRGHAKCHKSADIAAYLAEKGGTCGICCQKVSEAEAMVSGGVRDVLVSNEVTTPKKIERLAALATRARVLVCVDDLGQRRRSVGRRPEVRGHDRMPGRDRRGRRPLRGQTR